MHLTVSQKDRQRFSKQPERTMRNSMRGEDLAEVEEKDFWHLSGARGGRLSISIRAMRSQG